LQAWRALGENALQCAAVHVQPAGGFRDIMIAQLEDALDMLPADPVSRHRIFRRGRLVAWRQKRLDHIIGIGRLGQIVDRAGLHRGHGGGDIAIAGQHDGPAIIA